MLSWIACVNDFCKIYAVLKMGNVRYLERMDWKLKKNKGIKILNLYTGGI